MSDPPRSSPQGLGSPQELSTNLCGAMLVGCGPSSGNWVSLKVMLSASQKQAQVVGNLGQRRTISELATWEAVPGPRSVTPYRGGPFVVAIVFPETLFLCSETVQEQQGEALSGCWEAPGCHGGCLEVGRGLGRGHAV